MKNRCLGTLSILTLVLGLTTTVQAGILPDRSPQGTSPSSQVSLAPNSPSNSAMNSLELAIYNQVNQYRQSMDLAPLEIDPVISAQAKKHSEDMARTGNMSHDGFRERVDSVGQTITYRSAAENVATNMGYTQPDAVAIQGWIDSPGHHRNMIGRYNRTGIGVVKNAKGEYYFTQIFIRERSK